MTMTVKLTLATVAMSAAAWADIAAADDSAADDAGFTVRFAPETCPYEVRDGELVFDVDGRPNSTRDGLMSLHAMDKFRVHYLVTEKSEAISRFRRRCRRRRWSRT